MTQTLGVLADFEALISSAQDFVDRLKAAHESLSTIATSLESHVKIGEDQKQVALTNAQSIITAVEQECTAKIKGIENGQNVIATMLDYFHGVPEAASAPEALPDIQKAA